VPALAEIVVAPIALATTRPESSTEATAGLELDQVTVGRENPPVTVADSVADCPRTMADVAGVIVTAVIGRSGAVAPSELHATMVATNNREASLRIIVSSSAESHRWDAEAARTPRPDPS
jgi:hypothetical protein